MPTLADDLVAAFEPWVTPDLEDFLRAIGSMLSEVEELALDTDLDDIEEGWALLLDPDLTPVRALPYLAQFVGERLPVGHGQAPYDAADEALAREWVKDRPNSRRGTIESIVRVAQRTLTGQRTVVIHERNPDEDSVIVHTLTSETPNSAIVLRDLRVDAVPGDIVLSYSAISGRTYNDMNVAHPDYNDLNADYPTYNASAAVQPTGTTYTRPPP